MNTVTRRSKEAISYGNPPTSDLMDGMKHEILVVKRRSEWQSQRER